MPKTIIEINDLTIYLKKDVPIIKNISFEVKEGDFVQITGINGSGKSTLIKTILGIFDRVKNIEGQSIIKLDNDKYEITKGKINKNHLKKQELFSRICFVTQDNDVFYKSPSHALELSSKLFYKKSQIDKKDQEEILKFFDFERKKEFNSSELSGGEKRLVNIMCGLIRAKYSELLIMDEPLNHLDFNKAAKLNNYLIEIKKMNPELTIVLVSHCCMFSKIDKVFNLENKNVIMDSNYIFSPCSNFGEVDEKGFYGGNNND